MPQHFDTLAVHAGQETSDPTTHARAVPIYQTAAYTFDSTEEAADLFALRKPGNIYARMMNPTEDAFEARITALEGGVGSLAVASGMSAITYAVLNLCFAGDHIVALSTLYGGSFALFAHTLSQYDIHVTFVDPDDPGALAAAVTDRTRLVYGETIGNPGVNVVDLDAWAEASHALGLPLIIDNTIPSPYLCRPFEHGADIVVHSATKYIGGHGTAIGGVIVDGGRFDWAAHAERFPALTGPDHAYHEVVWTEAAGAAAYITRARTVLLRNIGASISPFNSWLFLQGLETLHLRMERHSGNALEIARYLEAHPDVAWVQYPGLESSPYREVSARILPRGCSGILTFGLRAGREAGTRFIESLKLFSHLANIGDAKSLAIHNASTTHSQLTEPELEAAGVRPEMVRLSVGIEDVSDLIADLEQALAVSRG
ncbi:O-acetylhomoserine aminocarboxypropyltransferase/cysteine synthase family protein [Acidipropionibacterium virtanenii]|uniref:L-methionine gamma-lyase n=1 Tax=Acidipropionibacterium virtanenii TaxID=2057246 RepID=A0A344UUC9_9ACTN|nr:O-acetylhomoserine aminocarboxypropyltransferase/cysteine synthase family protein [Acidipropionibacterium virtanenii]AXE38877.1 L-methionine gamma-lyase [Acidipropionibacterium virtanenii]